MVLPQKVCIGGADKFKSKFIVVNVHKMLCLQKGLWIKTFDFDFISVDIFYR